MRVALFLATCALPLCACSASPADDSVAGDAGLAPIDNAIDPGTPTAAPDPTQPTNSVVPPAAAKDQAGPRQTFGAQPAVYMQHNDVARTGANLDETVLDVTNVNKDTFGLVFSRTVVGQIYAQPLYAPAVTIEGKGLHDVVVVATEHDDVYAFDASDPDADEPLWHVHLAEPVPTGDLLGSGLYCRDLSPEVGITATPTIDPENGVVYVEAKEKTDAGEYTHRLHALMLASGAERAGSPVEIVATVKGTGDGSSDGLLSFDPLKENARAAVLLSHGILWLAYAGHCDASPFHGWVFAYDAATLRQRGVWVDTPDTWAGGIWMAGQGLAADENGDPFLISGNGPYQETFDGPPSQLGDSFTKLHLSDTGIEVTDWFTPFNQETLSSNDLDLGSTGVMFVPGTRWLIGAGKEGKLYVVDRDDMGKFHADDDSQIVQSFQATAAEPEYYHPLFGSPVFWNGLIYLWGVSDVLRAYRMGIAGFDPKPSAIGAGAIEPPMPGGILSISADGHVAGTGVLWASHPTTDAGRSTSDGVLRAFDASDITKELWNSEQVPDRDEVGTFAKFVPPTIAAGRVYLATFSNKLRVYGLLRPTLE
jgi:hypothetical protein